MLNFIFLLRQGLMSPQAGFQLAVEPKMSLSCSLLAYLLVSGEKNLKDTSWPQPLRSRSRGQPLASDPCLYLPQDDRHVTSCPVFAEVGLKSGVLDVLGKQSTK